MSWIKNTFEISHTTHKSILSMEGIRGFAVFLVFVVHYVTLVTPWLAADSMTYIISEQMKSIGNVGVDLFFVLSGYLIYGMLIKNEKPFLKYIARRVQRIYPTFTVVFVIYLILSLFFSTESKIPAGWEAMVFVIQNYLLLPGLFDIKPIITVAWSLSYEFFYYLIMPFVISLLGLRSWNPGKRLVFFIALSIISFWYFANYSGHIRLLMFVSGIVLFEVTDNKFIGKVPFIGLPALVVALASVMLMNQYNASGWWKYALLYVLFFTFCLECFVSSGFTTRLFSAAPMRWLGNMSYSYYLIHGLALKFLFLLIQKAYPAQQAGIGLFWGLLPLAFFATLIPSALLFVLVEKPYSLMRKPMLKKTQDVPNQ